MIFLESWCNYDYREQMLFHTEWFPVSVYHFPSVLKSKFPNALNILLKLKCKARVLLCLWIEIISSSCVQSSGNLVQLKAGGMQQEFGAAEVYFGIFGDWKNKSGKKKRFLVSDTNISVVSSCPAKQSAWFRHKETQRHQLNLKRILNIYGIMEIWFSIVIVGAVFLAVPICQESCS